MKKWFIATLVLASIMATSAPTHAQGTIYLSGLDLPTAGNLPVGNDAWIATYFGTGSAPLGYALNSIQLSIGGVSGNPSGFKVMIWDFRSAQPIITLTGPEPSASGMFTYGASDFPLARLTTYWFVVTSTAPVTDGSYRWNYSTADPIGSERWLGGNYQTSPDGVQWTRIVTPAGTPQFAVNATVIPEPSSLALSCCGGLLLAACLLRRGIAA